MPLDSLTAEEQRDLAQALAPWLSQFLLTTPTVFGGEPERLRLHPSAIVNNTYFNIMCGDIQVGENSFFGNNCSVITGSHDATKSGIDRIDSWRDMQENDITIGSGVWIGHSATILGPCIIGDNAVIGAGSVVLPGEYESSALYAGVPAEFKKIIERVVVAKARLILPEEYA